MAEVIYPEVFKPQRCTCGLHIRHNPSDTTALDQATDELEKLVRGLQPKQYEEARVLLDVDPNTHVAIEIRTTIEDGMCWVTYIAYPSRIFVGLINRVRKLNLKQQETLKC